jgi:hypothetical protein
MTFRSGILGAVISLALCGAASARDFTSTITESAAVTQMRPEFKRPDEPNQLFYVQRSPNSNTVIYAARLDAKGALDKNEPVEGFWRKFNIDDSKQPLNFIERMMAYGVKQARTDKNGVTTFTIAALPERSITLNMDAAGKPQALMKAGKHTIKLSYVYLHVVEGGLMPDVPKLEIFGTDIATGKAIHEHLGQK